MESSPGAEHAQVRETGTDSDWGNHRRKDHAGGNSKGRCDAAVLIRTAPMIYIPIGFQHSDAKCAKQKRNVQEFQNTPIMRGGANMSTTAHKQICRLGGGVK